MSKDNTMASGTMRAAPDLSRYPMLDHEQIGHLRHIHNLVSQEDNDWDGMGSAQWGQETSDSYRYQFAQMSYCLGFAHFHHLPAAPGAFRPTFEQAIRKMQLPEVWAYWNGTSKGSRVTDPDIVELREGWRDPIVKENIMYSGRLFAMLGMHSMLFDSDRYDEPGAISLRWEPMFQGLGPEVYEYSYSSIADNLYWQMAETGWYGVVCEPNCLFIVCNQFAILGFRFLDLRRGTSVAEEVTRAFTDAWHKRGMLDEDGEYWRIWLVKQDRPLQLAGGAGSQWTALNMNAWNRELVHKLYPEQIRDMIRRSADGLVTLMPPPATAELRRARRENRAPLMPDGGTDYQWSSPSFGYTAACMAELGDTENLRGMLAHADRYMTPTWRDGGLYYPRNDTSYDADGNLVYMDRLTGNAMLGYARLNVTDGLWKMYNEPWGPEHFRQPNLARLDGRADVARAWYDPTESLLALTLRPVQQDSAAIQMEIANVRSGRNWTLFLDGSPVVTSDGRDTLDVLDTSKVGAHYVGNALVLNCTLRAATDLALSLHGTAIY
ncbi:hypothetical protein GCM10010174_34590 [Kutzneria viridogrisea]|uniref:Linalool dehydratase/isomerase domain-containing protein n=1 Tax=Kutzneria viridogrisea TaxID=47990 RepID=A0ABR6BIP4_9PSEU|nr:hypothetical protein [Kutzneria viridogrisea]